MSAPGRPAQQPGPRPGQRPDELPARVTTPLLTLITQQSLDEDYVHVAERRAATRAAQVAAGAAAEVEAGEPATGLELLQRHRAVVVVVAVFGLMMVTAALQSGEDAAIDAAGRSTLIEQVEAGRADAAAAQERTTALRDAVDAAQRELADLREDEEAVLGRLSSLRTASGAGAVRGPGVRITIDDPPPPVDEEFLVQGRDLAFLTEGLWQAGAEAIAVDGQRLTVLSSFSNSGIGVNLGGQPLTPPYTVTAIGDPRTLQARFQDSLFGGAVVAGAERFGWLLEFRNDDDLRLPAASVRRLRSVEPVRDGDLAPREGESP